MLMLCFVPSPEQWSSGWGKPRSHLIEHLAAASCVWCHLLAGAGEKRDGRAGGRKKEKGERGKKKRMSKEKKGMSEG